MKQIVLFFSLIVFSISGFAQTSWSKNDSSHPLNGTWYLVYSDGTYHPVLDVYESDGRYTVTFIGQDIHGGEYRNSTITGYGDTCELMVEVYWDHRSDISKKGWNYYVDDRDDNADSGYPSTGQYQYNTDILRWYYTIDFTQLPLVMKFKKVHTDYYLNGRHTYSETDYSRPEFFHKTLTKK